jgi:hypothetical protein
MKGTVRQIETGLEQGLKLFKKQPAQRLEKINWYALRDWAFVWVCLG